MSVLIIIQSSYIYVHCRNCSNNFFKLFFYVNVKVSKDGLVGFNREARYVSGKVYSFDREKYFTEVEDYPFVAPFIYGGAPLQSPFADGNTFYGGKILYHLLSKDNSGSRDLLKISNYIVDAFIGVYNFTPSYGFVVTWVNVTDEYQISIARCNDANKPCEVGKWRERD